MNILLVNESILPVTLYGGTQRVAWSLAKELVRLNHKVWFLTNKNSTCEFAEIIPIDETKPIVLQIPDFVDIVHFHSIPKSVELLKKPYIITIHGNGGFQEILDKNSVFLSKNHALRHGSDCYVYNGLDWEDYGEPLLENKRKYFHFLGKASWRVKNVQGAIDIIRKTSSEKLHVLGGNRVNFSMGFRLTLSPKVRFHGMVGGQEKFRLLNDSKGLIFPILWHEPFGLAVIESLYFGCPVFATPYGSLPELVTSEVGFLSTKKSELVDTVKQAHSFSPFTCHEYAQDVFNSKNMALAYLQKYEQVISGKILHSVLPQNTSANPKSFLNFTE